MLGLQQAILEQYPIPFNIKGGSDCHHPDIFEVSWEKATSKTRSYMAKIFNSYENTATIEDVYKTTQLHLYDILAAFIPFMGTGLEQFSKKPKP